MNKQLSRTCVASISAGLLLVAVIVLPSCTGASGAAPQTPEQKEDAAKLADARHLLQVNGSDRVANRLLNQMIVNAEQLYPTVPQKFIQDFFGQVNPNELSDLVAPAYARHFSHDEIRQLITFYESPVGRKLVAATPAIEDETGSAAQRWNQDLANRLVEQMRARHYLQT